MPPQAKLAVHLHQNDTLLGVHVTASDPIELNVSRSLISELIKAAPKIVRLQSLVRAAAQQSDFWPTVKPPRRRTAASKALWLHHDHSEIRSPGDEPVSDNDEELPEWSSTSIPLRAEGSSSMARSRLGEGTERRAKPHTIEPAEAAAAAAVPAPAPSSPTSLHVADSRLQSSSGGKEALFQKAAHLSTFLSRHRPCAACNETEMQMNIVPHSMQSKSRVVGALAGGLVGGKGWPRRKLDSALDALPSGTLKAEPFGGVVAWSGRVKDDLSASEHAKTSTTDRLVSAAASGELSMLKVLLERGAFVDSANAKGIGPLHMAAAHKHDEIAYLLVRMKARIDWATPFELMQPLHYAARGGSTFIVKLLLAQKANPLVPDAMGRTASWFAEEHPETRKLLFDAMRECVKADETIVYPDPNLGLAALKGDVVRVKRLLANRADPNSIYAAPALATALMHACSVHKEGEAGEQRCAVAWALIEANANVNAVAPEVKGRESSGVTALHLAAAAGAHEMVRLLLLSNAEVTQPDASGLMPIEHVARGYGLTTAVRKRMHFDAEKQKEHVKMTKQLLESALFSVALAHGFLLELREDGTEKPSPVYAVLLSERLCRFTDDRNFVSDPRPHIELDSVQTVKLVPQGASLASTLATFDKVKHLASAPNRLVRAALKRGSSTHLDETKPDSGGGSSLNLTHQGSSELGPSGRRSTGEIVNADDTDDGDDGGRSQGRVMKEHISIRMYDDDTHRFRVVQRRPHSQSWDAHDEKHVAWHQHLATTVAAYQAASGRSHWNEAQTEALDVHITTSNVIKRLGMLAGRAKSIRRVAKGVASHLPMGAGGHDRHQHRKAKQLVLPKSKTRARRQGAHDSNREYTKTRARQRHQKELASNAKGVGGGVKNTEIVDVEFAGSSTAAIDGDVPKLVSRAHIDLTKTGEYLVMLNETAAPSASASKSAIPLQQDPPALSDPSDSSSSPCLQQVFARMLRPATGDSDASLNRVASDVSVAADDTSPLGIVCDIRLQRGYRMLTARSTVQLHNQTHYPLDVTLEHDGRASVGGVRTTGSGVFNSLGLPSQSSLDSLTPGEEVASKNAFKVDAGQRRALPVAFTVLGSERSMWSLRLVPTALEKSSAHTGAAQEASPWRPGALLRWTPATSLLVCRPHRVYAAYAMPDGTSRKEDVGSGLPWIGLVSVHRHRLPVLDQEAMALRQSVSTVGEGMGDDGKPAEAATDGGGGGASHSAAPASHRGRQVVRLFNLPTTEVLLETFHCTLVRSAGREIGRIHLTQGFLCIDVKSNRRAISWSEIRNPNISNNVLDGVLDSVLSTENEIVLRITRGDADVEHQLQAGSKAGGSHERNSNVDGDDELVRIAFFQSEVPRERVLQRMREVRLRALQELKAPSAQWRPRDLLVSAPLVIVSNLPCPLKIMLQQEREQAAGGHAAANRGCTPPLPIPPRAAEPTEYLLTPKHQHRIHSYHGLTGLRLKVWLDGPNFARAAFHGELVVHRPAGSSQSSKNFKNVKLTPPGDPTSKKSISLHIDLVPKGSAQLELIISAPHWLVNLSSLPVAVTRSNASGGALAVAEKGDVLPKLFSLALCETLDERARLFVPRPEKGMAAADPASMASMTSLASMASMASMTNVERDSMVSLPDLERNSSGVAEELESDQEPSAKRSPFNRLVRGMKRNLSPPFHVNVVGAITAVRVPIGDGRNTDLSVSVDGEGAATPTRRNTAVLTVRDRLVMRNLTGEDILWSEAIPGGSHRDNPVELILPQSGEMVPCRWSGTDERRLMQVRPSGHVYDWCMPFTPFETGGFTLCFRRLSDEHAETYPPTRYIRLSVADEGSQTIIELRAPSENVSLPFQIHNGSNLLLAFRQRGTRHWEMLGVGEQAPFAFDSTVGVSGSARRKLQVLMCDPYGLLKASTTTQVEKIDAGPRKVRVRLAEAKSLTLQTFTNAGKDVLNTVADVVSPLNPLGGGGSSSGSATDESRGRRLPPLEVVLMSSGCTMLHRQQKDGSKYDTRAQYSSGWLCATQNRVTFIDQPNEDSDDSDDDELDNPLKMAKDTCGCFAGQGSGKGRKSKRTLSSSRMPTRRATLGSSNGGGSVVYGRQGRQKRSIFSSGEGWSWHALDALPLPFEEIEGFAVSRSAMRDAMWIYTKRGTRLKIVDLRDASATVEKLQVLLRGHRDVRHTLFVMRLLAERTAQTANSAKLIAASWADRGRKAVRDRKELEDREREKQLEAAGAAGVAAGLSPPAKMTPTARMTADDAAKVLQTARRSVQSRREVERRRDEKRGGPGERSGAWKNGHLHSRPHVAALCDAVESGSERVFAELIQRAHPDSLGSGGSRLTALQMAALRQNGAFIRELLKAGANPDLLSKDGWTQTALHIAAAGAAAFPAGVYLLLYAGANPTIKRSDGQTAASLAPEGSRVRRQLELREREWLEGKSERIHRAELAEAAEHRHLGAAQRLLVWRTHPDSEGGSLELSALAYAALNGDRMMAALLLQDGADPNLAVPKRRSRYGGMRPLHLASMAGSPRCVKVLLEGRANPTMHDGEHKLPLFHVPDYASTTRELLLRSLVAFGGSGLATMHGKGRAMLSVPMLVRANGPVRELHLGDPEAAEEDTQVQLSLMSPLGDHVAENRALESRKSIAGGVVGGAGRGSVGSSAAGTRTGTGTGGNGTGTGTGTSGLGGGIGGAADSGSDEERAEMHCTVFFERLGICILDEEPCELLYVSASRMALDLRTLTIGPLEAEPAPHLTAELNVENFQIDNCLQGAKYPVMLASKYALSHKRARKLKKHSELRSKDPEIKLNVRDCHATGGILCIEAFTFKLHPLLLFVDQGIIARALRLVTSIVEEAAEMEEAIVNAERLGLPPVSANKSTAAGGGAGRGGLGGAKTPRGVAVSDEALEAANEEIMEIYVRRLELDRIHVAVTLHIENLDDDREHEESLSSLQLGPLAAIGSIGLDNWPLELPKLDLLEVFEAPESLVTRAVRHYILALLQATYRLILSLDNLGNLSQMFSAMHGGFSTLRDGAVTGNVLSGTILGVGGATVGVGQWAIGRVTGATEFVSSTAAKLTFDGHFKYHRAHAQQQHPKSLLHGMQIGFEVLEEAVKSGVRGVIHQPLLEGRHPVRFTLNVTRGVIGLVAKVASGSTFFVSKSCEGLAAEFHRTPFNARAPLLLLRVRQPRHLDEGVLLPYPPLVHIKDLLHEDSSDSLNLNGVVLRRPQGAAHGHTNPNRNHGWLPSDLTTIHGYAETAFKWARKRVRGLRRGRSAASSAMDEGVRISSFDVAGLHDHSSDRAADEERHRPSVSDGSYRLAVDRHVGFDLGSGSDSASGSGSGSGPRHSVRLYVGGAVGNGISDGLNSTGGTLPGLAAARVSFSNEQRRPVAHRNSTALTAVRVSSLVSIRESDQERTPSDDEEDSERLAI